MKKLVFLMAVAVLGLSIVGCKSITVTRNPDKVATNPTTGEVLLDSDGHVILLGGWVVTYFQHWNWQRFDSMKAKAGNEAEIEINGYSSGADSNLVQLVSASLDGVATVAEKVLEAMATQGVSLVGDAASMALKACEERWIANGGDPSKLQVTCKDGSCTLTDGTVTETCTDCCTDSKTSSSD